MLLNFFKSSTGLTSKDIPINNKNIFFSGSFANSGNYQGTVHIIKHSPESTEEYVEHGFSYSTNINGLFHGQGKIFTNEHKIYEGEFKNGAIHDSGKIYIDNVLRYEGQLFENKFHGFGKTYDENGSLVYEGNWAENELQGAGILSYKSTLLKGFFFNDEL